MAEIREVGVWQRRLTRRGFVRGAAAAGAATGIVSLASCAPASTGSNAAPTSAAAVNPPAAAPAAPQATAVPQVKLGGAFRISTQSETPNLDPHMVQSTVLHILGPGIAWSKLVQFKSDVQPGETIPTADLAESWEQPDDRTYIFKLQPNAKFHNIPPVNGRPVVADDVKFSFERQLGLKLNAGKLPAIEKIEVV